MQHPPYSPDWATPCRESLPVTERAILDLMSYVLWQALAALLVVSLVTIATGIGLLAIWCCKTLRDAWNRYHRCARRKPVDPPQPQGRPAPVPSTPPLPEGQDLLPHSKNLPFPVATPPLALSEYWRSSTTNPPQSHRPPQYDREETEVTRPGSVI